MTQFEQGQHPPLAGCLSKSRLKVFMAVRTRHHKQLVLLKSKGPGSGRRCR